jgi:hypothetical protein
VPEGDHDKELTFWQEATGQTLTRLPRYPEYHGAFLPDDVFAMLIQRLGTGPARVHLDIHTDDLEAETARLEALGARRLRLVNDHWWVMGDPRSARQEADGISSLRLAPARTGRRSVRAAASRAALAVRRVTIRYSTPNPGVVATYPRRPSLVAPSTPSQSVSLDRK